jgi:hypothetical protein
VHERLAGAARLAFVRCRGKVKRPGEELLVDARVVLLDRRNQLIDQVLVMTFDVYYRHRPSVLPASEDESPPEEYALQERTMPSMSLSDRRRDRKARKLARLLLSLEDSARAARREAPRKSLRASLSGAR